MDLFKIYLFGQWVVLKNVDKNTFVSVNTCSSKWDLDWTLFFLYILNSQVVVFLLYLILMGYVVTRWKIFRYIAIHGYTFFTYFTLVVSSNVLFYIIFQVHPKEFLAIYITTHRYTCMYIRVFVSFIELTSRFFNNCN